MTTELPPQPILTNRFLDAFAFAATIHAMQVRKGTSIPYVSHLMTVASIVLEYGGNEDAVIAALLHDSAEDQGGRPMLERIRSDYGDHVAAIVNSCTDTFDDPKPKWAPRKEDYVAHLREQRDADACLVSAADKLHNARAILRDVRAAKELAPEVWGRFSATEREIGWYYGSLESALRRRLAGHTSLGIVDELELTLNEIADVPSRAFQEGLRLGRSQERCPIDDRG